MPAVIFFKQHTIWLPKLWVVATLGIIGMYLLWFGVKNMANYLAISEPKYGHYLVVDGWLERGGLVQALEVFRNTNNRYKYLVTIGGPDTRTPNLEHLTYAEQSARYFLSRGVDKKQVVIISTPASAQARTYLSAVKLRDWLGQDGNENVSIDVFTGGVHARRTLFLYNLAFRSNTDIGVYAAEPSDFNLRTWWETSEGVKSTITEFLGFVWVIYFFDPGEYDSHQERWGVY